MACRELCATIGEECAERRLAVKDVEHPPVVEEPGEVLFGTLEEVERRSAGELRSGRFQITEAALGDSGAVREPGVGEGARAVRPCSGHVGGGEEGGETNPNPLTPPLEDRERGEALGDSPIDEGDPHDRQVEVVHHRQIRKEQDRRERRDRPDQAAQDDSASGDDAGERAESKQDDKRCERGRRGQATERLTLQDESVGDAEGPLQVAALAQERCEGKDRMMRMPGPEREQVPVLEREKRDEVDRRDRHDRQRLAERRDRVAQERPSPVLLAPGDDGREYRRRHEGDCRFFRQKRQDECRETSGQRPALSRLQIAEKQDRRHEEKEHGGELGHHRNVVRDEEVAPVDAEEECGDEGAAIASQERAGQPEDQERVGKVEQERDEVVSERVELQEREVNETEQHERKWPVLLEVVDMRQDLDQIASARQSAGEVVKAVAAKKHPEAAGEQDDLGHGQEHEGNAEFLLRGHWHPGNRRG